MSLEKRSNHKKDLEKEMKTLLKKEKKRQKTEAAVLLERKTSSMSKTVLSDLQGRLVSKHKSYCTVKGKERKQQMIKKLHKENEYQLLT